MSNKTIVTCSVTGDGAYNEKMKAVPITPEQIADECISAVNAGAAICHIHVRDPKTGAKSMSLEAYREVVERIRASATDVVINLTTGVGSVYIPDQEEPLRPAAGSTLSTPEVRARQVVALRPELCTLNVGTMNFGTVAVLNTPDHTAAIARASQQVGTTCAILVYDVGHIFAARKMLDEGLIKKPPFFQICLGVAGCAPATPEVLLAMRGHLPHEANWGAFGKSEAEFPMVAQTVLLGGHVQVGLADNLYLSHGNLAPNNAALVERAVAIVRILGGETASPAEAREILGLKSQSKFQGRTAC
ncbi:3-keto-5-aminohexanoate cleavage protein [Mesorhizobium sp.]|uniref:3-keto-5-aminohexanoate cleavage protein n=1 Tax=Mesorhizobium sp. TaxID=1871066 RepID=UPI000FE52F16|nr:3-keto-5-aminohexanoate cleavage protein [Mesorhizobium sp.]RWD41518.1 MAG: 3-keto-5-aminohexanoate cleavage protein [Mesorhizobium sp.]